MKVIRKQALRLRLQGQSFNEIHRSLGVPKSTLSLWLQTVVLSNSAKARLAGRVKQGSLNLIKRNKLQTHKAWRRAKETQEQGRQNIGKLDTRDLFLAGVALYWAEGYKRLKMREGKEITGHAISFVNADPEMVRVFLRFLREILKLPPGKIRLSMRLYDHINEQEALRYWMRASDLPRSCFRKSTYLISSASKRIRPRNRLPFGSLQIEAADTMKFHYILGAIEGMKEKL